MRAIALRNVYRVQSYKFAVTIRIRERTTALAFASGNMVCTGAKTEIEARIAGRKYVRVLQKHGIPVSFRSFKIQNIVASAELHTLKLLELSRAYGPYVSYEPDLFRDWCFGQRNRS